MKNMRQAYYRLEVVIGIILALVMGFIMGIVSDLDRPGFQKPLYNWNGDKEIGTVTCMGYEFGMYNENRVPYGCRAWFFHEKQPLN